MVIKIGINGFGRIGRVIFRTCVENTDIEVTAINDPAISVEYICYLIKFDSTHGKFKGSVTYTQNIITVNGKQVKIFNLKQPSIIPWHEARVQYVVEASGMFTSLEKASGHLSSEDVKCVIITSPSVDAPMIILGVNDVQINQDTKILSCASSTLYCLAPIIKVLEDNFGVSEGFVTSIHAMTPSLKPLDGLCIRGKHWRDHRSIHQNIIPASTGACKALGKIIPSLQDCLSGLAFRVPIVNVSVLDISIRLSKCTTLSQIVRLVNKANESIMKNIIRTSTDEAVSSDFMDETHSCILDVNSCLQLKPDFLKLVCWYENEYSYACRVIDTIRLAEERFNCTFVRPRMTLPRSRISSFNSVKNNISSNKGLSFAQSAIKSKISLAPKDNELKQKIATSGTPLTFSLSTPKGITTGLGNRGDKNNNELKQKSAIYPATSNLPLTSLSTPKDISSELGYGETKNIKELRQKSAIYPATTKMPLTSSLSTPQDITSGLGCDRTKNSNEIFRSWNVDHLNTNIPVVQDNRHVFRSCMEFTPTLPLGTEYNQSRLEKVKAEFSKMANITEHLLRKSQSNKVQCNCLSVNRTQKANEVLFDKKNNEADKEYDNKVSKTEIDEVVTIKKAIDSESTVKTEGVAAKTPQITAENDNIEVDEYEIKNVVVDSKSQNKCNENVVENCDVKENALYEVIIENTDGFDKELKYNSVDQLSLDTYFKDYIETESMKSAIEFESKMIMQASKITQNIKDTPIGLSKGSGSDLLNCTPSEDEYPCTLTSSSGGPGEKSANFGSTSHEDRPSFHSMRQEDNKSTHSDSDNETIRSANDTTSFGIMDSIFLSDNEYNKEHHETCENAQGQIREESVLEQQIIINTEEIKSKASIFEKEPETAKEQIVIDTEEVESKTSILEEQPLEAKEFLKALNSRSSVIIVPLEDSQTSENEPFASTATNIAIKRYKKDIYDKLSSSGTESEQSFGVNSKKSEVISIKDLTNSLEDLERLEKICKIIEISDDLSDRLFSPLDSETDSNNQKKWSFKDLCNRIKLDEFCDKVFSK